VKRLEHFWKGLSHDKTQISPVPAVQYGDRFVNFVEGITKSKEEAGREDAKEQARYPPGAGSLEAHRSSNHHIPNTDNLVIRKAETQATKTETRGSSEDSVPERTLGTVDSPTNDRNADRNTMTLPMVDEAGESSSTGGRSGTSNNGADDGELRPPTPPKDKNTLGGSPRKSLSTRKSSVDSNKALPAIPRTENAESVSEE